MPLTRHTCSVYRQKSYTLKSALALLQYKYRHNKACQGCKPSLSVHKMFSNPQMKELFSAKHCYYWELLLVGFYWVFKNNFEYLLWFSG